MPSPTDPTPDKCRWKCDDDGNWWTACGEGHIFTTGTPTENSHRFCPYCGKPIEEEKPDAGTDD